MSFSERIVLMGRMSVPYLLMAAFFVLALVSVPAPLGVFLDVPYVLMVLFYWSLYRPTLLPYWLVFIAGLLIDILAGFPIGMNALILLLVRMFVTSQRRFVTGQNFVMLWLAYAIVSSIVFFAQWLVLSLANWSVLPLSSGVFLNAVGLVIFPVVCLILHATHQILPAPQGDIVKTLDPLRSINAKL